MTPRGWLSTWSEPVVARTPRRYDPAGEGADLHPAPTADTEIRLRQAREVRDLAGSDDVTYHELEGAPHYLEGHRREAMQLVAEWLRGRYP